MRQPDVSVTNVVLISKFSCADVNSFYEVMNNNTLLEHDQISLKRLKMGNLEI